MPLWRTLCCCLNWRRRSKKRVRAPSLPVLETLHDFEDAVASDELIVVACYVSWCQNCIQIAPKIEHMAFQGDVSAEFYQMDIDVNQDASVLLEILATPTFLFFKSGSEIARIVGSDMEKVEAVVSQYRRRRPSQSTQPQRKAKKRKASDKATSLPAHSVSTQGK